MSVFLHAPENDEKRGHTIDPVAVARQDDKHEDQAPHHGSGSPWEQFDSGDAESYDHTGHILHQPWQKVKALVGLDTVNQQQGDYYGNHGCDDSWSRGKYVIFETKIRNANAVEKS